MLYEQRMTGPVINWPRGKPPDRPNPGTNPEIAAVLTKWECRIEWASTHYELINKHGDAIEMSVTAGLGDWTDACQQLGQHRE